MKFSLYMVTKSQIKFVKSLQQKKYRTQNGLFVAEGKKMVQDLLMSNCKVFKIFGEKEDLSEVSFEQADIVTRAELKQMSSLKNPASILGVFYMFKYEAVNINDWMVVLDGVSDPGNLGTIIRLCDWFGIKNIVCSPNTVDCYNPKVLQATMGSIARVHLSYTALLPFLKETELPVYGSFMGAASVYDQKLPKKGILVMGNEGQGISTPIEQVCTDRMAIPQFGTSGAESLNVATATAIFLSEIRRG